METWRENGSLRTAPVRPDLLVPDVHMCVSEGFSDGSYYIRLNSDSQEFFDEDLSVYEIKTGFEI